LDLFASLAKLKLLGRIEIASLFEYCDTYD
jgi:hypothetical protein